MNDAHVRPRLVVIAATLVMALAPAECACAASAEDEIASGDAAYARGQLAASHAAYAAAVEAEPSSFGALWRLARVESELGEDAKGE